MYFGFSADDAFGVFAIQGSHLVFKHGVQNPVSTHSFQDFEEDSSYSWLLLKIVLFFEKAKQIFKNRSRDINSHTVTDINFYKSNELLFQVP